MTEEGARIYRQKNKAGGLAIMACMILLPLLSLGQAYFAPRNDNALDP